MNQSSDGEANFVAVDLYQSRYDFVIRESKPSIEYMLAAIPRSGSTYLTMELWRTGVMGAPLEYPNPPFRDIVRKRLGHGDSCSLGMYWNVLRKIRTSPNGVFGFKMFIGNYIHYSKNAPDMLSEITPDRVVFLTRSDAIKQAVSYSKAMRSGAWFGGVRMKEKPTYDANHIYLCMRNIQYQIDFWNKIFALTETSVYHVTYEALLSDKQGVLRGVAEFLGVELTPGTELDLPRICVQRNAESAEWAERFKGEDLAAIESVFSESVEVANVEVTFDSPN